MHCTGPFAVILHAMGPLKLGLLAPALALAAPLRTTVSIDLGWRFYRGLPVAPGPCTTPFNLNYTGQQCDGLSNADQAITQDECAAA